MLRLVACAASLAKRAIVPDRNAKFRNVTDPLSATRWNEISKKKNHESKLILVGVKRDDSCSPWPKIIGIHGSSFRDLIPSLRLRRRKRVREVTKFCVTIGDKGMLWLEGEGGGSQG